MFGRTKLKNVIVFRCAFGFEVRPPTSLPARPLARLPAKIENIENIEIIENMENIEIIELMISNISKYQNIIENVHTCSILHLSFSILSGNLENL